MQDPVQEIKNRLDVVDVVSPYVQLKKAGKYLKACCPFHQEKTPSFFVSPERQLAYCFSCQKGGDIFQFIQDIEGVDFRGALEILAEKANIELPKNTDGPKISKDEKSRLKSANQLACKFFVQRLWETEDGAKVLVYLRGRAMTDETIKTFQVGFAPDGKDNLYRYLLEKKCEKQDLLESTLVVARDSESKQVTDRFWLRLMFPIDNSQGEIVAFNGRALKKDMNPKYLNSPEYVLYNKGSVLYNLSRAKQAIRDEDLAICVEGQFDVMASHQAGVKNVVATSGTALTENQFKLLKRYTKRIALAFDSDSAGQEALLRAIHTAQPLDLELFVIEIPQGKDTADAVKEDPKLWISAVEKKQPYLEFYENKFKRDFDLEKSTGKREFTDAMLDLIKGVTHPVEKDHFLKRLSKLVGTPVEMLYDYLNAIAGQRENKSAKSGKTEKAETSVVGKRGKRERLVEYFLGMLLAFPSVFFATWEAAENFDDFLVKIQDLGLNRQINRFEEGRFKEFFSNFVNHLASTDLQIDVSSVYKQVRDHYNLHAEVDEVFYASAPGSEFLQKLAFEAEVKNPDHNLIAKEFEKLIALLYFEFTS